MLPATSAAGTTRQPDRKPQCRLTFTTQKIKGIAYAVFPAATGNYVATYAPYR